MQRQSGLIDGNKHKMFNSDRKVIELGPHERMTPEEAIAEAAKNNWEDVVILGFERGNENLTIMSSRMSREWANWIADHFKDYCRKRGAYADDE